LRRVQSSPRASASQLLNELEQFILEIDIIIEEKAALFICAVGVPPRWAVDKLHAGGVVVANMVGSVRNTEKALEAGADVIIVGVPDQYIVPTCQKMKPFLKKSARLILLAKGVEFHDGKLLPVTEIVAQQVGLASDQVCCLMGANIAREVAHEQFSESTLACRNSEDLGWLRPVVTRGYFPIATVRNVEGPQMCGALKNIVAIGKGIIDGMGMSSNTMAALMRIGMKEMQGFILEFFDVPNNVFWESCCFADLITTCMSGRNQLVAAEFARRQGAVTFEALEHEMLDGQHLQGTITAVPVHMILKQRGWLQRFPLLEGVYQIVSGKAKPESIVEVLKSVPQTIEG